MNLTTRYLGLTLEHPFVAGASPMVDDLGLVRRLEDAGAAAIVMHSLYEEQLTRESLSAVDAFDQYAESFAEAASFLPAPAAFALGPDEYLEQIVKIKATVAVPVIASLNGTTAGGWLHYARLMEEAGADALELNLYSIPTDLAVSGEAIERRALDVVDSVVRRVSIPVAVKLSPWYSSLGHFATRLDHVGARGLVLFNRFYQADIDPEQLEVRSRLELSQSAELLPRLTWLAILSGRVSASLAVTGGVHTSLDAIKAVMAGADVVQMVSALLRNGPDWLTLVREGFRHWLLEHEYESIDQLRGSMNLLRCPDPAGFERAQYLQMLNRSGGRN
ncbi:MAG: dihydroorotate dehydrogenase-like protein [Gemmatimonadetes bacterium]|nr:dihydroorotate dehydrogenase-like protein [Gemmatimonadota bacterium]MCC7131030.1 dihydroorotate dehydrogenase-like protein [Gemmatimonadales bacterium]